MRELGFPSSPRKRGSRTGDARLAWAPAFAGATKAGRWLVAAILLTATSAGAADSPWGAVRTPSAGAMQAIGGGAHGCLAGAAPPPAGGPRLPGVPGGRQRLSWHSRTHAFLRARGG